MTIELDHDGDEDFDPSSDSELPEDLVCKSCGRIVLVGPPCCYNHLYGLWSASIRENNWLKKVQSKQTKRIQELQKELRKSNNIIGIIQIVVILFLIYWFSTH